MKKSLFSALISFLIILPNTIQTHACTGVRVRTSQGVLVGGNEDYNNIYRDVIVRVRPPVGDHYGYIGTGFERHSFFMMGINDQGLFLDMFTVPPNPYTYISDPNKLNYNGFLEEQMLKECANVDEAIAFFNHYNHPSMVTNRYQIFVADSEGNSAVISWCNSIEVVRSDDDYQVVTNFFLNHTDIGWYPCWRYADASDMLAEADSYSFDLVRNILSEVHLGSNYSQICNLNSGDIYIFYNHNFDESVRINLDKELKKGRKDYLISNYYAKIELLSPGDEDVVSSANQVTFEWEGSSDVSYYQLFVSDDANFSDCDPITIFTSISWAAFPIGVQILLLGIIVGSLNRKNIHHKRIGILVFLFFSLTFFCLCKSATPYGSDDSESSSEINTYEKTVKDLQKGVTHYWKINAKVGDDMYCVSKTNTFTLSD